jgi:hypothetical protein
VTAVGVWVEKIGNGVGVGIKRWWLKVGLSQGKNVEIV